MEEAVIKIDIDGGNSKTTLGDLKKEIQSVEGEGSKLGAGISQGAETVAVASTSLKTQLREMKEAMLQLPEGGAEFEALARQAAGLEDRIADVNNRVKLLSSDTRKLDTLAGAGQAIAGGFQAASGAMGIFGANAEVVQKAMQRVVLIQGVMNGVQQFANALNKESALGIAVRTAAEKLGIAVTKQHAAATGLQTIGMKAAAAGQWLLNAAMNANPIGLIVIGITALVAGFIAFKKPIMEVINSFKSLGDVLNFLISPFTSVLKWMGLIEDKEAKVEKQRQDQSKANRARYDERIKQIKKEREEYVKAKDDEISALELQIDTLDAEGKATEELRLQVLEAERDKIKANIDSAREILKAKLDLFEQQARLNGKSNEEFGRSIGVDFQASVDGYTQLLNNQEESLQRAENNITRFNREQLEKRASANKGANDEKLEDNQKAIDEQKAIQDAADEKEAAAKEALIQRINKLQTEYTDSLLTDQQREVKAVSEKYDALIAEAEQYGQDVSILKEAQNKALLDIENKYQELQDKADDEARQKKNEDKRIETEENIARIQKEAEDTIEIATSVMNSLESIYNMVTSKEIDRLNQKKDRIEEEAELLDEEFEKLQKRQKSKDKLSEEEYKKEINLLKKRQETGEKLSKKEEQKLKRDVAVQKAFALAKIAIDTASSITSAIAGATASAAAAGPGAVVATPVFIASQIATVLAAVGSAVALLNAPTPSISKPSSSGGLDTQDLSTDAPDTDIFNTGSTLLNAPPTKVYVLEQDISDSQNNVAAIKQQATYG